MNQLSMEWSEKLDSPLASLCNGHQIAPTERVPVIVRCGTDALETVAARILTLGGSVRHTIALFGAVVAWVPLFNVQALADQPGVRTVELEQEFTIA